MQVQAPVRSLRLRLSSPPGSNFPLSHQCKPNGTRRCGSRRWLWRRRSSSLRCPPTRRNGDSGVAALLINQLRFCRVVAPEGIGVTPGGDTALHVLAKSGTLNLELKKKVLEWTNKGLTTLKDEKGSTPPHFAAALPRGSRKGSACSQTFEANTTALYQPDKDGLYPIHVAASLGEQGSIAMFVEKCPSSAGLCDTKGRTFLHVATEEKQVCVVFYACTNRSLTWILDMQDNEGSTALHLVVQAGSIRLFSAVLGKQEVNLNLRNAKGQTPLDIYLHITFPQGCLIIK
ncbi:protein ACCELERATED CELL DEATH 6-like [Setaria italica]|uniref:protein ACCELERATED CELL DEATH 6-like n=1 Tax=Setaria italica TaxID=4555 RepID=UPI000BE51DC7|nr:protein ACCELERATED CELL DEATH 6-like [Setaria italica]